MARGKNSVLGIASGIVAAKFLGWLLRRIRRALFRWRRLLAPVWFAVIVWLIACVWHWLWPSWWPIALAVPVAGVTLAVCGPRLSERWQSVVTALIPDGLDRGHSGMLDRPVERAYFGALTSVIGGWMALRVGGGPTELTERIWQWTLLILGGIWWYHRRVRVAGGADWYTRKWVRLKEGRVKHPRLNCLIGSTVVRAEGTRKRATLWVRLGEAITVGEAHTALPALESFYRLRPGAISVAENPTNSRYGVFTILAKDPWGSRIDHPMPAPRSTTLATLDKRLQVGLTADGKPDFLDLENHTLLVGQTGSGKSIFLHNLMTWLCACRDVAVVGIDMAGGATLKLWSKAMLMPIATNRDEAVGLLERTLEFMETRERELGLRGEDGSGGDEDSFAPSEEHPWLVLIIDEFPDLTLGTNGTHDKEVIGLLQRIAKRSRKCGIRSIIAAQNGSKEDLGSKELQGQYRCQIGMRLEDHNSKVLWGGLARLGWSSKNLGIGEYLLRDPTHTVPSVAKGFFVPREERREVARQAAEQPVRLEPAGMSIFTRQRDTDLVHDGHLVVEGEVAPEDPLVTAILEALRDGPMRAADLAVKLEKGKATVHRKLRDAKAAGRVCSVDGEWQLAEPIPVDVA
jgi:FtsK/SpoIIIE family